ncbi:hypothetical protein [Moraxella sp. ZY200743]
MYFYALAMAYAFDAPMVRSALWFLSIICCLALFYFAMILS